MYKIPISIILLSLKDLAAANFKLWFPPCANHDFIHSLAYDLQENIIHYYFRNMVTCFPKKYFYATKRKLEKVLLEMFQFKNQIQPKNSKYPAMV